MRKSTAYLWLTIVAFAFLSCASPAYVRTSLSNLQHQDDPEVARGVVLFIGDGMGPGIISIAKIYSEVSTDMTLNVVRLANDGYVGLMTSHSADRLVTDSAASGTAMATGHKTSNGMVGMLPDGTVLKNIFEEAYAAGKSVGVVTTTSVTDATPASFLAHSRSRTNHEEIALQIIEGNATVVLGGGLRYFLPPERGARSDGRDLTEEATKRGFDVVFTRQGLIASKGTRLLGLFASGVMPYERARNTKKTPSLSEMVAKALDLLSKDEDGFVLVVEGGRIDHAEHENNIADALGDFFAFDAAVGLVMEYASENPGIAIIVTADHDCGGPAITATPRGYPTYKEIDSLVGSMCPFVKWVSDSHTGTMVPVFAIGPGAKHFKGVLDNTDIHDRMLEILGLGVLNE